MEIRTMEWPDVSGDVDVMISAELANNSDRSLHIETYVRLLNPRRFMHDLKGLGRGDCALLADGWDTFMLNVTRPLAGSALVTVSLNWGSVSEDQKLRCVFYYQADDVRLKQMTDQIASWIN